MKNRIAEGVPSEVNDFNYPTCDPPLLVNVVCEWPLTLITMVIYLFLQKTLDYYLPSQILAGIEAKPFQFFYKDYFPPPPLPRIYISAYYSNVHVLTTFLTMYPHDVLIFQFSLTINTLRIKNYIITRVSLLLSVFKNIKK